MPRDPGPPPLVEVAGLWPDSAAEPAWVELLRSRAYVLESDGRGRLRARVPADGESPSADAAWRRAWPVLRHALAAEQRRLAGPAKGAAVPPLTVDVHVFRHRPERSRFELTMVAHRVTVADTRPDGRRAPLDLAALRAFFEHGRQLEGGRLDEDGHLTVLGSEPSSPPTLMGAPVSLADLAVAWRAVTYGGKGEPYMSLDRGFGPQSALVNYGGRLRDTRLGLVSLLCDVRFKTFSQGVDLVAGRDVRESLRADLPRFRTHLERFAADAVPGVIYGRHMISAGSF